MKKTINGFTIVELLVVIAIIGIMATIGIVSFSRIQSNARNTQRSSRITIISEALEKYFDKNGEYPSCAAMIAAPSTITTTTLKGLDPEVLTAPTAENGINSFSCSDPTSDTYAYISSQGGYTLKYLDETTGTTISFNSRRVAIPTNYIAGVPGTVLEGKYVYSQDLGLTTWGPSYSSCPTGVNGSQPCQVGLDAGYISNAVLISPQTYPNMDFSLYPAQNACKAVGGRLPNTQEVQAISANSVAYGNNFQAMSYWSATESNSVSAHSYSLGSAPNENNKIASAYLRCVKD